MLKKILRSFSKNKTVSGGVSNDMLLTLSMGHQSSNQFQSNQQIVNYLQKNNFIGSSIIQSVFEN